MRWVKWSLMLLLLAGLTGCQSSLMVKSGNGEPKPEPGKAMVVFMRPSALGGAVQSSVYDTHERGDKFIGIVSTKTRIAYQADPGDHLFMVWGENIDFMIAHLDAGKIYYALVSPRMGVLKARFSLLPIHNRADAKYNTQSEDFRKWMSETSWVDVTPQANDWYTKHSAEIQQQKTYYTKRWNSGDAQQHAELTLSASDGM